jgi:hypothetical protein
MIVVRRVAVTEFLEEMAKNENMTFCLVAKMDLHDSVAS